MEKERLFSETVARILFLDKRNYLLENFRGDTYTLCFDNSKELSELMVEILGSNFGDYVISRNSEGKGVLYKCDTSFSGIYIPIDTNFKKKEATRYMYYHRYLNEEHIKNLIDNLEYYAEKINKFYEQRLTQIESVRNFINKRQKNLVDYYKRCRSYRRYSGDSTDEFVSVFGPNYQSLDIISNDWSKLGIEEYIKTYSNSIPNIEEAYYYYCTIVDYYAGAIGITNRQSKYFTDEYTYKISLNELIDKEDYSWGLIENV